MDEMRDPDLGYLSTIPEPQPWPMHWWTAARSSSHPDPTVASFRRNLNRHFFLLLRNEFSLDIEACPPLPELGPHLTAMLRIFTP